MEAKGEEKVGNKINKEKEREVKGRKEREGEGRKERGRGD